GRARRVPLEGVDELASLISSLGSDEAIALGALREGLPAEVQVVTKNKLNGPNAPIIARTTDYITYRPGQTAFVLIDFDRKGMPDEVKTRLDDLGGFWQALCSVMPAIATIARVVRSSTSAGLVRSDTGERLPDSGGLHVYLLIKNGSDIKRFLET